MKKILFGILLFNSAISFAVTPTIWNMGNQVQVQIYNNTQDDINCSGPIYIYTQLGQFRSEYYQSVIYKGMSDYKYIYVFGMNMNDRITNTSHGIFCRRF